MIKTINKAIALVATAATIVATIGGGLTPMTAYASEQIHSLTVAYGTMLKDYNGYGFYTNQVQAALGVQNPTTVQEYWNLYSYFSNLSEEGRYELQESALMDYVGYSGASTSTLSTPGFMYVADESEMAAYPTVPAYVISTDPSVQIYNSLAVPLILNALDTNLTNAENFAADYVNFVGYKFTDQTRLFNTGAPVIADGSYQLDNIPIRLDSLPAGYQSWKPSRVFNVTQTQTVDQVAFGEDHHTWADGKPVQQDFKTTSSMYDTDLAIWQANAPVEADYPKDDTVAFDSEMTSYLSINPEPVQELYKITDVAAFNNAHNAWESGGSIGQEPFETDYMTDDVTGFNNAHAGWELGKPLQSSPEYQITYTEAIATHDAKMPSEANYQTANVSAYNSALAQYAIDHPEPVEADYTTTNTSGLDAYNSAATIWNGENTIVKAAAGLQTNLYMAHYSAYRDILLNTEVPGRIGGLYNQFSVHLDMPDYSGVTEDGFFIQNSAQNTVNNNSGTTIDQLKTVFRLNPYYTGTLPNTLGVTIGGITYGSTSIPPVTPPVTPVTPQGGRSESQAPAQSAAPAPVAQSVFAETKEYAGISKTLTLEEKKAIINREPVKVDVISEVPTAKQLFIAAATLNRFDTPLTSIKAGTTPLQITSAPAGASYLMGNATQGPECMKAVLAHTKTGDVMLRSFSLGIYKGGRQLEPSALASTKAKVSVLTADKAVEEGYKYVLLCVESGGKFTEYEDIDNNPKTVSAEVGNFGAFFVVKRPVSIS